MSETTEQPKVQLPTKAAFKALRDCKTLGDAFQSKEFHDRIAGTIPKHLHPDIMLHSFINATGRQPLLMQCDMRQVLGAFMQLSYLGLPPGTMQNLAHLTLFAKNRYDRAIKDWVPDGYTLQIIIGYPGYIELAHRSGFITDFAAAWVLPGDDFDFERGSNRFLRHRPNLKRWNDTAEPEAVWAMAKLSQGGEEFEVMPWGEVLSIRNAAQAYLTAKRAYDKAIEDNKRPPKTWTEAPWVKWPRQQGRKTVLRRLCGMLPKCPELRAGAEIEGAQEGGKTLDFGPIIDGEITPEEGPVIHDTEEEEASAAGSAGATFTDRRETTVDKTERPRPTTARRQTTTTRTPETKPLFSGVLIDAYGNILGEHTSAIAFANALLGLKSKLNGDHDLIASLIDHNADVIEEARAFPDAAKLLAAIDEPPPTAPPPRQQEEVSIVQEETTTTEGEDADFEPVAVPVSRGRKSWPMWTSALTEDMADIQPEYLGQWLEVQRATIMAAPAANRAYAIKAIVAEFTSNGEVPPDWLADALGEQQPEHSGQAEQTVSKDHKWVDDRKADLAAMPLDQDGRAAYDTLLRMDMTKTVLKRLKSDDPALYADIDGAFREKNRVLPKAIPPQGDQR